jgi:two-component system chemotaxis response regulator CheB
MKPIRVLIVDDSPTVRRILTETLAGDAGFSVVGAAPDPFVARDMILELKPDVVTLDIEMPRMDGLTFLRKIMRYQPLPVVIISSLGQAGCRTALAALESGAVEVLVKPNGSASVGDLVHVLPAKLRAAVIAKKRPADLPSPAAGAHSGVFADRLIAIGASTGGTEAIARVLKNFPPNAPPVVVAQHLPPKFSAAFAERLNELCKIEVKEAAEGDELRPGRALVAPGDFHLILKNRRSVSLSSGPKVCYQRPSVDVLFASVVDKWGSAAAAALLTGMGTDGAEGLKRIKDAGGFTVAQDEASCVVFGMPGEAIRIGAARSILHLDRVAGELLGQCLLRQAVDCSARPALDIVPAVVR